MFILVSLTCFIRTPLNSLILHFLDIKDVHEYGRQSYKEYFGKKEKNIVFQLLLLFFILVTVLRSKTMDMT
jgi:1,4-dihydroxy-2-naphthoate octaprenyltransferase